MSKQLPKRVVSFKLEKHPTAERLAHLRSQGIENIDDLDRVTADAVPEDEAEALSATLPKDEVTAHLTEAIDVSESRSHNNQPLKKKFASMVVATDIDPVVESNSDQAILITNDPLIDPASDLKDIPADNQIVAQDAVSLLTPDASLSTIPASNPVSASPLLASKGEPASHYLPNISNTTDIALLVSQSHSSSAELVYQLLKTLAEKKGRSTIRISTKELLAQIPVKSHVTIRKAIDELLVKQSLEIVAANQGKIAPLYRIILPDEIIARRQAQDLVIDEDTRFAYQAGVRIWPPSESHVNTSYPSHDLPITTNILDKPVINPQTSHYLAALTPICQQLGVEISGESVAQLAAYPLPHTIIGICEQVAQHKGATGKLSLADCLTAINQHYQQMRALPESILTQVAYDRFAKLVKN